MRYDIYIYMSLGFKMLKQSSGTDRFRQVCKFQCSYVETDKPVSGPASGLASSSRHANLPDRQFGPTGCV